MRWTQRRSKTLADAVDDLFVFCALSEENEGAYAPRIERQPVHPYDFKDAEGFIVAEDGSCASVSQSDDTVMYFRDVMPQDVPGFDASCAKSVVEEGGSRRVELYGLSRAPLRAARGRKLYSPHVAWLRCCHIDVGSGTHIGWKVLVNKAGQEWVTVGESTQHRNFYRSRTGVTGVTYHDWINDDPASLTETCQVLLGVQFTRDLLWRVVFKSPCGFSLSLSTDVAGAMAAFRNREPNIVTGRREALRHWVRQHHRIIRSHADDEAQSVIVREHLRGRTPFRWMGMDCELVVSPFDVRRNERLREERLAVAAR